MSRDSCSIGGHGDPFYDDELRRLREELEDIWCPTEEQAAYMASLCRFHKLDYGLVTADLNTKSLFSAKLDELATQKRSLLQARGNEATEAQLTFAKALGFKEFELAGVTKQQVSAKIQDKLDERDTVAPTGPQLSLLHSLKYSGPAPATKNKASEIIRTIKLARRIRFIREKARRRGTDPAMLERLIAMVTRYNL